VLQRLAGAERVHRVLLLQT